MFLAEDNKCRKPETHFFSQLETSPQRLPDWKKPCPSSIIQHTIPFTKPTDDYSMNV